MGMDLKNTVLSTRSLCAKRNVQYVSISYEILGQAKFIHSERNPSSGWGWRELTVKAQQECL